MAEKRKHTIKYIISNPAHLQAMTGAMNKRLALFEDHFEVEVSNRGEEIIIQSADPAEGELVREIMQTLVLVMERYLSLSTMDFITAIKIAQKGKLDRFICLFDENIGSLHNGEIVRPKTYGQLDYIQAIKTADVVFGVGPAGTGKTFLAVVKAVQELNEGRVKRIIITRPAVEAGENLGFLPGDLKEKVDPYLRPIYDALQAIYGSNHMERLMERNVIEIAPLAYMRGRTLDDAFVILDEAQNTTVAQMKMFLTRLGFGSKMVINGDISQIDLPKGVRSGLKDALHKLKDIRDVSFVYFDEFDVVRHPVVANIIKAYENYEE